VPARGFEPGTN